MTYEESAALMQDIPLRNRIKVSALKYAGTLLIQPVGTEAVNTKRRWAQNTQQQPDMVAAQLQPSVVMDPAVQADGAAISDAALQTTVEIQVNSTF
jgi:hypothetical protein